MGRKEQIINERLRKLKELRASGVDPYPNRFESKDKSSDLQDKYKSVKAEEKVSAKIKLAGRVMTKRDLGKIAFASLADGNGMIQIILQEKETPEKVRKFFKKYVDSGDFVGVEGGIFRTKRGELSILVKSVTLLSKSILPLPEKHAGLQDEEERLRKRYLDILMNADVKSLFVRKSKFWQSCREFLLSKDFLEVETPVLENSAGGAAATPFSTHHNAMNIDVFLRISMGELCKRSA